MCVCRYLVTRWRRWCVCRGRVAADGSSGDGCCNPSQKRCRGCCTSAPHRLLAAVSGENVSLLERPHTQAHTHTHTPPAAPVEKSNKGKGGCTSPSYHLVKPGRQIIRQCWQQPPPPLPPGMRVLTASVAAGSSVSAARRGCAFMTSNTFVTHSVDAAQGEGGAAE